MIGMEEACVAELIVCALNVHWAYWFEFISKYLLLCATKGIVHSVGAARVL